MILELIESDYPTIIMKLYVVSGLWGAVLMAILVDLYFGIRKAKELGEVRTSEGYKRSVGKFTQYFAMMFFALLFDAILPVTYFFKMPFSVIPIISLLAATALILTEAKSVREHADMKLRRKTNESFKQILELLEREKDIKTKIGDLIMKEKFDGDTKNKE